jgi:hypothetical protein
METNIPTDENTAVPGPADVLFSNFRARAVKAGYKYAFWNDSCYAITFNEVVRYTGPANLHVYRKYFFNQFKN